MPEMHRFTLALCAILALQQVDSCNWPLLTDEAERVLPDAFVRISSVPKTGGLMKERGLFMAKAAAFGPCPPLMSAAEERHVELAVAKDAGSGSEACNGLQLSPGAILVADRGTCNFLNKTMNAFAAEASGLIVGNVLPSSTAEGSEALPFMGCPADMDGVCKNVTIPAVAINSKDKLQLQEWLKNAESAGVVLVATIYEREHPTFDPSSFVIWLLATFTVIGGSKLSAAHDTRIASSRHTRRTSPEGEEEEQEDDLGLLMQNLSMAHAVGFVVFASIMLVVLFFFIRTIIILLVVIYCIASTSAMAQLGAPLLARVLPATQHKIMIPLVDHVSIAHVVCSVVCMGAACVWFVLRHSGLVWPLQDIMSISLCLQILSSVRFSDIKVPTVLLSLALVYDVFWVFISPLLFSENVMIATATGRGHNWSNSSYTSPPEMLPMLLVVPKALDWAGGLSLLGLGDIVLPGLLVAFALRVDVIKLLPWRRGYFWPMVAGYGLGLALAVVASVAMRMGQPALLYLVPCTLWPFLLLAWARGELRGLWEGLDCAHRSGQEELLCPGSGESSAGEDAGGGGYDGDGGVGVMVGGEEGSEGGEGLEHRRAEGGGGGEGRESARFEANQGGVEDGVGHSGGQDESRDGSGGLRGTHDQCRQRLLANDGGG